MDTDRMQPWRDELQALGFTTHDYTPQDLVGVRLKTDWAMCMRLTLVIRVKHFESLDLQQALALEAPFKALATRLDPSLLPRGFQQGRFIIDVFVADQATEEVRGWAARTIRRGFATSYHPVVLCDGKAYHDRLGFYGAALWPKIEYMIQRMTAPLSPRPPEVSGAMGVVLGLLVFWPGVLLIALCCCGLPVLFAPLVLYLEKGRKESLHW